MRCPHCHSLEDKVIESRTLASGDAIRRRRECIECGYRFTSYERIEEKQLMVVKRTGDRREPFSREKLERGIQRALEKRPVSQVQIENIINQIEDEAAMKGRGSHEIASHEVGEMVLKKLYRIDRVAYIRFASVYRNFEDVDEFVREIETLSVVADDEQQDEN
ncbi:transcriptional regulator NrdR [Salinispira pacifica]